MDEDEPCAVIDSDQELMIVDPSPAKKSKRSIRDMMTSNLLTMTKESLVENQKVFNDERQSCAT